MIGLTSYRDYFATPEQGRSSKYESLCQYAYDLSIFFDKEIKIIPTVRTQDRSIYDEFDTLLIFEHPTSFLQQVCSGFTTPNIYNHFMQIEGLFSAEQEILSYNLEAQDTDAWIKSMGSRRKNLNTACYSIPTDDQFRSFFSKALDKSCTKNFCNFRASRRHHAIGDSHVSMLWKPGRTVNPLYGRTLYRTLANGLESLLSPSLESVIFCFGNIDLRHHLARQKDPKKATVQLATSYVEQASKIEGKASICELLPIITEDRFVPKSYFYEKEPHFGSTELRMELQKLFNKTLHETASNVTILRVPSVITHPSGLLPEDVLEKTRGGIHIAPKYYECSASYKTNNPENAWLP